MIQNLPIEIQSLIIDHLECEDTYHLLLTDRGLNDEFKPYDSGVSDFKMLIFNKFGEKIFESNDINLGWDGYFNGKIVQGSYVYKMEFILNGKNVIQTGNFLLIK